MSRKQIFYIFSIIFILVFISFYITRKNDTDLNSSKITSSEENKNEIPNTKSIPEKSESTKLDNNVNVNDEKNEADKKIKEMSPKEYVAWLKDPQDRVLLEIKPEGTSIFRKGNVTITVMPNGEEIYLPDEF
ncbi:hypothetical protein [Silvanigrella sp.]|jgi:hypothetical protein|uniref:hypothetical protein n=1 Tax=Silvanigrella sp. TaxID=2024976 RepID=UPI0037C5BB39